jgi:20S proteasome alpha/beta subunit
MTTIVGIKTNSGPESIVLATDTQFTWYKEGIRQSKDEIFKLRVGDEYALAFAGNIDKNLSAFLNYVDGKRSFESYLNFVIPSHKKKNVEYFKKIIPFLFKREEHPIKEATENWYFPEFNILNTFVLRGDEDSDLEQLAELVIAKRNPLGLYQVDVFGNISESDPANDIEYIALGSGSEIVENYIDDEQYKEGRKNPLKINYDDLNLESAIDLAIGALKKAMKDTDTGGIIDLAIVDEKEVIHYGPLIKSKIQKAERDAYKEIKNKYVEDSEKSE